ncbi:MAG: stage V sporulation T C-terminal domain-containing protein, partial [Ruthenibacterium sp.]
MKATGIVRRIDDLGRVVIPKEIRRTQLIRVGDPLEIFVSGEGEVIFKKYSPIGELSAFAQSYVDILTKVAGICTVVTDRDRVVSAGSAARETIERRLSAEYEAAMETRRTLVLKDALVPLCEAGGKQAAAVAPILCHGDMIGSVALLSDCPGAAHGQLLPDEGTALALIHVAA